VRAPPPEPGRFARLGGGLRALSETHPGARLLVAWLADGEFVIAAHDRTEVDYALRDEPDGGRVLELRLRLPPGVGRPG
jgi:hypothetical protein